MLRRHAAMVVVEDAVSPNSITRYRKRVHVSLVSVLVASVSLMTVLATASVVLEYHRAVIIDDVHAAKP